MFYLRGFLKNTVNKRGILNEFSTKTNATSKELYKYLLRQCKKLPEQPQKHYRFMVKQSFKQHVDETDAERIKQIIERSYQDAEWVLKKYLQKKD